MSQVSKRSRKSLIATLAALLLFAAATFQIAGDNILLGVVFFASASCFSSLARIYHERESREDSKDIRL